MSLMDKVVIVTGAAHGIGRGIAEAVAAAGAKVVIADVDEAAGQKTVAALAAQGAEALFAGGDLTDESTCRVLVEKTIAAFGRLDGLVNNIGVFPRATLEETTGEFFDHVMSVNLKPALFCCKHAIPFLKADGGSIVNIGSGNAYAGSPNLLAYSMSKGALLTMTRNLARAYARNRIRANLLSPGWVLTEKEMEVLALDGKDIAHLQEKAQSRILGRFQTPEDAGQAAVFLLSDAASQVTSQVINLDGHY